MISRSARPIVAAADRGIGAVARSKGVDAAIHANFPRDRAVHNHQRRVHMGGRLNAIRIEPRLNDRLDHGIDFLHFRRYDAQTVGPSVLKLILYEVLAQRRRHH